MIGMLILVALVSLALEPPTWVQILLGIGLVLGGVLMTVLVAAALSSHENVTEKSGPRRVERATSD
jgi:hypothetical protein